MLARVLPLLLLLVWTFPIDAQGQTRRRTTPRSAPGRPASQPASKQPPKQPADGRLAPGVVREAPLMQCPSVLGNGIKTQRLFCDILTGPDPASGLRVSIPAHDGPATLLFMLHNRQTTTEVGTPTQTPAATQAGTEAGSPSGTEAGAPAPSSPYARYTATLRVILPNGTLVRQTIVQSEYRGPADLVERIAGGPGRGGFKAVAPTGSEAIALELPAGATEVILLGEKLTIERLTGSEVVTAPGRPIAVVSQVQVEYRPVRAKG